MQKMKLRFQNDVEKISHQSLKNMNGREDNLWKDCPYCGGAVPLTRSLPSMKIQADTSCLLCGQKFHFTDIIEDFLLKYKKRRKK